MKTAGGGGGLGPAASSQHGAQENLSDLYSSCDMYRYLRNSDVGLSQWINGYIVICGAMAGGSEWRRGTDFVI